MRKKNYKGVKCTKRYVNKCGDVCKTYDAIQYAYANLLSETHMQLNDGLTDTFDAMHSYFMDRDI